MDDDDHNVQEEGWQFYLDRMNEALELALFAVALLSIILMMRL